MRVAEVVRGTADSSARRAAVDFVDAVTTTTGSRPISDHLWLDLRDTAEPGPIVATIADRSGLVAMAQLSSGNDSWSLEAFARPDVGDGHAALLDAAETAVDRLRHDGGGRVYWWVDDPVEADERFAAAHGLAPDRALHEMRRPLPHELRADIETRAFRPGVDDAAWLEVNNRAFADHGEQGGWTTDTLARRTTEDWFDPDGFRLHEIDGRLAGFCWTKLHHEHEPTIGEIYVIAVDPEFHGRGLGKQLTLAGLDSITARDVPYANLYVDADNEPAVRLYDRLGFEVHRTRRAYVGDLVPAHRSDEEFT